VVDQTVVKFDSAMVNMRNGCYSDYEYHVYDESGNLNLVKGGYCICDNGYLKWPTMMPPTKTWVSDMEYNWSEMLESLRKDIECLFGQMKQEFAILKYGSRFNSMELMDDIFLTCCAIHNQRKIISGSHLPWSDKERMDEEESDLSQTSAAIWRRLREQSRLDSMLEGNGNGGVGSGEHNILAEVTNPVQQQDLIFKMVKQRLVTHSDIANKKGEVYWPTRDGTIRNYHDKTTR
jgi:Plant transposon protein